MRSARSFTRIAVYAAKKEDFLGVPALVLSDSTWEGSCLNVSSILALAYELKAVLGRGYAAYQALEVVLSVFITFFFAPEGGDSGR